MSGEASQQMSKQSIVGFVVDHFGWMLPRRSLHLLLWVSSNPGGRAWLYPRSRLGVERQDPGINFVGAIVQLLRVGEEAHLS